MTIKIFYGEGSTQEIANNKATIEFIQYCKLNNIGSNNIKSFTPAIWQNEYGCKTSLWTLIDK